MERRQVDVAVIGAGTAGLNARREAERAGKSTVLIEDGPYGTMCARVGCMPSKLLIAAAHAAHEVRGASRFGVHASEPEIDGKAVLERVRAERDRFVGFVVEDTEALPEEVRVRGRARFVDARTLDVDGRIRIEAGATVVATGSAPVVPEAFSDLGDRVLTNDAIFELEDLPKSVAVIGAGVIGLELGQALHRLGVDVILFSRSGRLGPFSDPAVQQSAASVLGSELRIERGVPTPSPAPGGVALRWTSADGSDAQAVVERVLVAAGRRPSLDGIGLEGLGIARAEDGVPRVDPNTGRIEDLPIFLAGDVTGTTGLLHEAADEGRIAGYNAARFPSSHPHRRRTPLNVVFSDPQMAVVGRSFDALAPGSFATGAVDYGDQGRARVMGRNAGLVHVYVDRETHRLVGAEMFGPDVEHTAHLLAWVIQRGLTVHEILELPFYHPVVEEGIRTALRGAAHALGIVEKPCAKELDCGPGA